MKVGFIGAGNMASAMIGGIINSKLLSPSNIIASAKTDKTLDNIKEKYKIEDGIKIKNKLREERIKYLKEVL